MLMSTSSAAVLPSPAQSSQSGVASSQAPPSPRVLDPEFSVAEDSVDEHKFFVKDDGAQQLLAPSTSSFLSIDVEASYICPTPWSNASDGSPETFQRRCARLLRDQFDEMKEVKVRLGVLESQLQRFREGVDDQFSRDCSRVDMLALASEGFADSFKRVEAAAMAAACEEQRVGFIAAQQATLRNDIMEIRAALEAVEEASGDRRSRSRSLSESEPLRALTTHLEELHGRTRALEEQLRGLSERDRGHDDFLTLRALEELQRRTGALEARLSEKDASTSSKPTASFRIALPGRKAQEAATPPRKDKDAATPSRAREQKEEETATSLQTTRAVVREELREELTTLRTDNALLLEKRWKEQEDKTAKLATRLESVADSVAEQLRETDCSEKLHELLRQASTRCDRQQEVSTSLMGRIDRLEASERLAVVAADQRMDLMDAALAELRSVTQDVRPLCRAQQEDLPIKAELKSVTQEALQREQRYREAFNSVLEPAQEVANRSDTLQGIGSACQVVDATSCRDWRTAQRSGFGNIAREASPQSALPSSAQACPQGVVNIIGHTSANGVALGAPSTGSRVVTTRRSLGLASSQRLLSPAKHQQDVPQGSYQHVCRQASYPQVSQQQLGSPPLVLRDALLTPRSTLSPPLVFRDTNTPRSTLSPQMVSRESGTPRTTLFRATSQPSQSTTLAAVLSQS